MKKPYEVQSAGNRKSLTVHNSLHDRLSALADQVSLPRQVVMETALDLVEEGKLIERLEVIRQQRDGYIEARRKKRVKLNALINKLPDDEVERLLRSKIKEIEG